MLREAHILRHSRYTETLSIMQRKCSQISHVSNCEMCEQRSLGRLDYCRESLSSLERFFALLKKYAGFVVRSEDDLKTSVLGHVAANQPMNKLDDDGTDECTHDLHDMGGFQMRGCTPRVGVEELKKRRDNFDRDTFSATWRATCSC